MIKVHPKSLLLGVVCWRQRKRFPLTSELKNDLLFMCCEWIVWLRSNACVMPLCVSFLLCLKRLVLGVASWKVCVYIYLGGGRDKERTVFSATNCCWTWRKRYAHDTDRWIYQCLNFSRFYTFHMPQFTQSEVTFVDALFDKQNQTFFTWKSVCFGNANHRSIDWHAGSRILLTTTSALFPVIEWTSNFLNKTVLFFMWAFNSYYPHD